MNPHIPVFISVAFIIAIFFPIYLIADLSARYAGHSSTRRLFAGITTFYILYLTGVGIATLSGAFAEAALPPTIIRYTTIPLLIFLLLVISQTKTYKEVLKAAPLSDLVRLHRFRFIGGFFIVLTLFRQLPVSFGLIAGLGDILTALTSMWLASAIKNDSKNVRKWVIAWNTFGLLDIVATSTMAIFLTKNTMETGALGVDVLATFPFCFIPAFAPATIIFLHFSIYRVVFRRKNLL